MRALRAVTVLLVVAVAASCAPVKKQEAIDRIARAARFDGVRTGAIAVSTTSLVKPPTGAPSLGVKVPTVAPASLRVVIDRTHGRAALLAPPAAAAKIGATKAGGFPALVVFDDTRVYVRSSDAGLVGARPWLAADIDRLGAVGEPTTEALSAPRTAGDLVVLDPIDLLDLARGFLTGSLHTDSHTPTTYRGRTSLDKDFREQRRDPSDADTIHDLLRSFSAKDDVQPIVVELDGAHALRRLAVSFLGKPEYGVKLSTTFDLTLDATPKALDPSVLDVPDASEVVLLDSLGDLRAAVDQWTAVPSSS